MTSANIPPPMPVDAAFIDSLTSRRPPTLSESMALRALERSIANMRRSGEIEGRQRTLVRVWRYASPVGWAEPISIGPAIVPFSAIETSDLGVSELNDFLGGNIEDFRQMNVDAPADWGVKLQATVVRRGPLSAIMIQIPDDVPDARVTEMVTLLRENWDGGAIRA